jgi:phosphoglycolate phosphatase
VVLALLRVLADHGVPASEAVASARDPFDVLRYAGTISTELAEHVEARLRANELEATRTAAAAPQRKRGDRRVAQRGPTRGDRQQQLGGGRRDLPPPSTASASTTSPRAPTPILRCSSQVPTSSPAVRALDADAAACALVGDSRTDMTAARLAGVAAVGYANKAGKHETLADAGADVVIDDMEALVQAVAIASA